MGQTIRRDAEFKATLARILPEVNHLRAAVVKEIRARKNRYRVLDLGKRPRIALNDLFSWHIMSALQTTVGYTPQINLPRIRRNIIKVCTISRLLRHAQGIDLRRMRKTVSCEKLSPRRIADI